jgi:hypothetical protein
MEVLNIHGLEVINHLLPVHKVNIGGVVIWSKFFSLAHFAIAVKVPQLSAALSEGLGSWPCCTDHEHHSHLLSFFVL